MRDRIGWGILGTGGISARFTADLIHAPGAHVAAVASRSLDRAEAFRAAVGAGRAHVEVEALAADPAVDVVYVGTPHVRHAADTLACLAAGKAVLCEKPLTPSLADAARVVEAARARGVFLMEAMWTRFFPAIERLLDPATRAELGAPTILHADFGFTGDRVAEPRLFDPAYAGGALLDVGVYPIWLALALLGPPETVSGACVRGPTGVEERAGVTMTHASGALSVLSCAITADTGSEAVLYGERGAARLDAPWWRPTGLTLSGSGDGAVKRHIDAPHLGVGYAHEAIEVMRCLRAGLTESPAMPHAMSLEILRVVEALR